MLTPARNRHKIKRLCRSSFRYYKGLVITLINKLAFEAHLSGGYQFCGSGTNLRKRLARRDLGINGLDKACKGHDIS